jgi:hypothetical protein
MSNKKPAGMIYVLLRNHKIKQANYIDLPRIHCMKYILPVRSEMRKIYNLYRLLLPWYKPNLLFMIICYDSKNLLSDMIETVGLNRPIYAEHKSLSMQSLLTINMKVVETISECIINLTINRRKMDKYLADCFGVHAVMIFRLLNNEFINFKWVRGDSIESNTYNNIMLGYGFWKIVFTMGKRVYSWRIMDRTFYTMSDGYGVCLPPFPNLHKRFSSYTLKEHTKSAYNFIQAGELWFVTEKSNSKHNVECSEDPFDKNKETAFCGLSNEKFQAPVYIEETFRVYCNDFYLDVGDKKKIKYNRGFYTITITADNKLLIK